ncbi:MAG TPA: class I SAM-dependent methyltransferase [Solirubrobacteraceae bacterium]|jgi:SAM-dependent methyltransferase
MAQLVTANDEAIEAWDGPLYDRFVQFRHLLVGGLGVHGDEGLRVVAPKPGERALDIGCGFGDTTLQLAELVGADGSVLGVDASPRFIETAVEDAAQASVRNARFAVADVEAHAFEEQFDLAFSRMGTMFFANPVAALRNVRKALVPRGRLAMVVWRSKVENEGFYRGQQITEQFVTKPEEYDEPTCGPGPFSMGNADTTSGILVSAGFEQISLLRCDKPILVGVDLDEAVDFVMSIGPAGEILRLAGERAAHLHEPVAAALREDMARWVGPDGTVRGPASTWIVTARVPAG